MIQDSIIEKQEKQFGYKKDTQDDIQYQEEGREQADYTDDKINNSQLTR